MGTDTVHLQVVNMAALKYVLGLLALLAVSAWAEEEVTQDLSVSELLWKANKDVVHTEDEPYIVDDIAYENENERNADPCTSRGCMWGKSSDGKVYVPYIIKNQYSSRELQIIERGLQSFSSFSCIRFVKRTNHRDYLHIQSLNGCYSYVGRTGNAQTVSLSRQGCIYHNKINTLNQGTPYDYNSVMQYHRYAFSKNNQPTMVPIPNQNIEIGKASQMSRNDIDRLNRLYKC